MPDPKETPPAPASAPVTPPPASTPPAPAPTDPKTPPKDSSTDPVELAKKVGELEGQLKVEKEYREKSEPILETLWSDPELLASTTKVHNKRLGYSTDDKNKDKDKDKKTTVRSDSDKETRQVLVNRAQADFEAKVGIDQLEPKKQKEVRGAVGVMLKEMLDPKNNKTIEQIFEDVSLVKLPWYLEKAHQLANRDVDLSNAKNQGKNEVLGGYEGDRGVVGSMPAGSSDNSGEITLTAKEREVAAKQGVSEEDYLKSKKAIAQARG